MFDGRAVRVHGEKVDRDRLAVLRAGGGCQRRRNQNEQDRRAKCHEHEPLSPREPDVPLRAAVSRLRVDREYVASRRQRLDRDG